MNAVVQDARPVRVAVADSSLWHLVDEYGLAFCEADIPNLHAIRPHDSIAEARQAIPTDSAVHLCSRCIARRQSEPNQPSRDARHVAERPHVSKE